VASGIRAVQTVPPAEPVPAETAPTEELPRRDVRTDHTRTIG
jgi:hypothetical protein